MALAHSPKIVTDSLALYYDMDNRYKSWKGQPTTNLIANGDWSSGTDNNFTGWNINDATSIDAAITYYMGIRCIRMTRNANNSGYDGISATPAVQLVPNTTYTITLRYAVPYNMTIGLRMYLPERNSGGAVINWHHYLTMLNDTNGWNTFTYTFTTSATATSWDAFRFDWDTAASAQLETVYLQNVQLELGSTSTPFVNGTRSSTQAILDLVGGNTVTISNLVYESDGTFRFNGSNGYLSLPYPISSTGPYSIIQWVKANASLPDTTNSGNRKTPLVGPGPVWNPGYWLTGRVFRVHAQTEYRDVTINWVNDLGWHQIGQMYDGTTCYHIIDGKIVLGTRTSYTPAAQSSIYVGGETVGGGTPSWNGLIGVTQIYSKMLSEQEVQQNFNALRGRYGI